MTKNKLGSEIFQTEQIKTDEYVMLCKTMLNNGSTIETATLEIEAIDDMLSILKIRSIINTQRYTAKGRIRKDVSVREMINTRIDKLLEEIKQ